ncbi:MAG TPA: calcium-binding protein [Rhizomicrobium sp.]|nr:calcium-binding protein [Rhizomicrobium sp.]
MKNAACRLLAALCGAVAILSASPAGARDVLAGFSVSNDSDARTGPRTVTFGQIFRRAAIRPGTPLDVVLNGAQVPAQMNAKALYPDGSVRHAIITLAIPAMRAGADWKGTIAAGAGAAPPAGALATVPALAVAVTFPAGGGRTRTVTLDLPRIAQTPSAQRGGPWLAGPLVREIRYAAQASSALDVEFDVRTPVSGAASVDVIFHNDLLGPNPVAPVQYGVQIALDGKPVFTANAISHHQYATWHRVISSDTAVMRVELDRDLLMETGAVPRYAAIAPDSKSVREMVDLAARNSGVPMSTAGVNTYMPETGGRPDLGPLPTWAVYYLLQPNADTYAALLANADAAGGIPWHMRDPKTGGALTNEAHPDIWLDERAPPLPGLLPKGFSMAGTGWTIDDAHQPSLTYLPYLLTGSRYYHDELEYQASYDVLWMKPEFRGAKGMVLGAQVRGFTWMMRTLANAAFILPAEDPLQGYYQRCLEANLDAILRKYVDGHEADWAGELKGFLPGAYSPDGAVAAWQDDYLAMVLGWIDAMGFDQARRISRWMTPFIAGLFTNADRGYDPRYGTPYILFVWDMQKNRPLNSWAQAFAASFDPVHKPVESIEYPGWAGGYAALARGALGANFTVTRSPQTAEAYGYILANTGYMPLDYPKTPTFAIMPVMPDGETLRLQDVHYADDGGDHLTAGNHASALVGSDGNDRLIGGPGSDFIYGYGGNDYLDGGPGDDYVFAGDGNSTIIVGPGADVLKAGKGTDTFLLKTANKALATIIGFKPKSDRLVVSADLIEGGAAALPGKIGAAAASGDDLVVTFGPAARVAFAGFHKKDIPALAAAISAAQ